MKDTSRSEPATLPIKTVTDRPLNSETRRRFLTFSLSPMNLPNCFLKTYPSPHLPTKFSGKFPYRAHNSSLVSVLSQIKPLKKKINLN
jgi:hypothetical protein